MKHLADVTPTYRDFRDGDMRHSLADTTKARTLLGYQPTHRIKDGIGETVSWYVR
jgi:UDP-N-acetylglucosamine 4-epimerase